MTHRPGFRALDKDLGRIGHAEVAQMHAFRPVWRLGLAVLALVGGLLMVMALSGAAPGMLAIGAGLVVAAWLGVAIGANDVANSLGPAVGAGAIGLLPGLALVAVAGVAGRCWPGRGVGPSGGRHRPAGTLGRGRARPDDDGRRADRGGGLITLATGIGLPVSTSHSIVGGIAGRERWPWACRRWLGDAGDHRICLDGDAGGGGGLAGGLLILLRLKVVEAPDRAGAALCGCRCWSA
ncbi:hypothetical protein FLP41_04525 [Paracoccus marcusii]|uniref:hypothetical protein n=1 Tax=Paracoccus marcusii TaxID=59779 RepID=UPI002ED08C44|nr:hypothetical protein FLP41_04525 [Paracoccus marcusii]